MVRARSRTFVLSQIRRPISWEISCCSTGAQEIGLFHPCGFAVGVQALLLLIPSILRTTIRSGLSRAVCDTRSRMIGEDWLSTACCAPTSVRHCHHATRRPIEIIRQADDIALECKGVIVSRRSTMEDVYVESLVGHWEGKRLGPQYR